ncbi:MAG: 16S rRNA (cytidine(1402)-2'-O)-methyltransferase [Gammaproteobacteria bacterium]|nr:16S rRNA (cytidine(1402)-2'-O)-methyltransferase [Gammaproteobacteria bacterium]
MPDSTGTLYIVATPIGNLSDFSPRAVTTLSQVDTILAEDTRHSMHLLHHFNIKTPMQAFHEHNEAHKAENICERLHAGENLALISDAGTPLLSDPGYRLVNMAQDQSIRIVPIPGPSAPITALSVSGLATDRFVFEGFLPAKSTARKSRLHELGSENRSLIFFESPKRILSCLQDMCEVFGGERLACVARELTKTYETIRRDSLVALVDWVSRDLNQQKGEFVVIVQGAPPTDANRQQAEMILRELLPLLSLKQAVAVTAKITQEKKNQIYELALQIKDQI